MGNNPQQPAEPHCEIESNMTKRFNLVARLCAVSVIGLLFAAARAPAADRPWFEGRWAEDQAWCEAAAARQDERPVLITPKKVDLYEEDCRVLRAEPISRSRYHLHALCREHGEEGETRRTFRVSRVDSNLRLEVEGAVWVLSRCTSLDPSLKGKR
jgi:hypothetical protein